MARYADTSGYTEEENLLWEQLIRAQGTAFRTAKGLPFTYVIRGNELFVSRRERSITRATVNRADAGKRHRLQAAGRVRRELSLPSAERHEGRALREE